MGFPPTSHAPRCLAVTGVKWNLDSHGLSRPVDCATKTRTERIIGLSYTTKKTAGAREIDRTGEPGSSYATGLFPVST